jgi:Cu+-exporting ATPase
MGAWRQLKAARFGMDALVTLGASAAYGYSVVAWATGVPGHRYFLESSAILTFISIGHWLEARVGARAERALQSLLRLAPPTARRVTGAGAEEEVPIGRLAPGDRVRLRPGDTVPTDGAVLEGESNVNESMLTGESVPVKKAPGSLLYAGTSTLDGTLLLSVTSTGEATALSRIIAVVRRAQTSRANIQRLADRVSQVFVPAVIAIACLTLLAWGLASESMGAVHGWLAAKIGWNVAISDNGWANAWIYAAAVLIIACPCAMGIATPAAITAAANAAARRGILIRDGIALERAGNLSLVLFDKTGTLTRGCPSVSRFERNPATPPLPPERTLQMIAAAVARPSRHPVSAAVSRLATDALTLEGWQEIRGRGVRARLAAGLEGIPAGTEIRLGAPDWALEGVAEPVRLGEFKARATSEGATVAVLALGSQLAACLATRDEPRPEAALVLRQLREAGLKVGMISGDNLEVARQIGGSLGLDAAEISAGVRPEQKADLIKGFQAKGQRVAFVGDGVNDAPALASANLGIAVTQAADVARESADLVLLRADLRAVPESLQLARDALRIIRQNLFWAFFYNAVAVPLAALGFMNPMLCALAMGLSDVLVIGNSLRLLRRRSP